MLANLVLRPAQVHSYVVTGPRCIPARFPAFPNGPANSDPESHQHRQIETLGNPRVDHSKSDGAGASSEGAGAFMPLKSTPFTRIAFRPGTARLESPTAGFPHNGP